MEESILPDNTGHEACNQTIDELLQLVASQRALLESTIASLDAANQTIATLNSLRALMPTAKTEKRGRGRPRKIDDDAWMIAAFSEWEADFKAANKYAKVTDSAVITWAFEQMFAKHNLPVSKVRSKGYQSKLKTLKNRLGDVRNPVRKLPVK